MSRALPLSEFSGPVAAALEVITDDVARSDIRGLLQDVRDANRHGWFYYRVRPAGTD